jgi:hypothetical protein
MGARQYCLRWSLDTALIAFGLGMNACRRLVYSMSGPLGGVLYVGAFVSYNRHEAEAWPTKCALRHLSVARRWRLPSPHMQ